MEATVTIEALAYGPAAVAHLEDGKACFVTGAAPGDVVRVAIDEDGRKLARGHVVEVLEAGLDRAAPACPLAATCGGCPWQHVGYEAQLAAKRANVVDALTRIGGWQRAEAEQLVAECVPSKRRLGYRNKLELACTRDAAGRFTVGLHGARSGEVVPVAACPLANRYLERAPKALQGALRYLEGADDLGIYRIGVRASLRRKSTEVALWTPPSAFPRAAAAKTLGSAVHATSIVRVIAEPGRERAVKRVEALDGDGFWHEQLGGFEYRAAAPSFFQVNTAQAEKLVELVMAGLEPREDARVADLYAGVGTFTLPLAEACDDVVAVESAASSVRDLRRNVEDAGVWVDVLGGDSARELAQMGRLDALVVDPPRAGLADGVPESIAATGAKRVAYVSCDCTTWARDAARLRAQGYELARVTPVDLFPQTYHCELVSIFARRTM